MFSIDSLIYELKLDWNMEEYRLGVKCKEMFKNGDIRDCSVIFMSLMSIVSFNLLSFFFVLDFSFLLSFGEMVFFVVNSDFSYFVVFSMFYKIDVSSLGGYFLGKSECGNFIIEVEVYFELEDEDKIGIIVLKLKIKKEVKIVENKLKLSVKVFRINFFKYKRVVVEMLDEDEEMMEIFNKKRKLIVLEEFV